MTAAPLGRGVVGLGLLALLRPEGRPGRAPAVVAPGAAQGEQRVEVAVGPVLPAPLKRGPMITLCPLSTMPLPIG
ncbi:MAG: hypothetical protein U0232_00895 [Thermomicrobiales bacterium]